MFLLKIRILSSRQLLRIEKITQDASFIYHHVLRHDSEKKNCSHSVLRKLMIKTNVTIFDMHTASVITELFLF